MVSGDNGAFDFRVGTDSEDGAGNALAAYTHTTKLTLDNTPPTFRSARVVGSSLTLTFNEALDTGSTPAAGDFVVTVGGTGRTVSSVAVSGRTVTLTLASAVTVGSTVNVRYTQSTTPGAALLQDAAGNAMATFRRTRTIDQERRRREPSARPMPRRRNSEVGQYHFDIRQREIYADASQTAFTNTSVDAIIVTLRSDRAPAARSSTSDATINAANTVITVNPNAESGRRARSMWRCRTPTTTAWAARGLAANATFTVDTTAPTVAFSPADNGYLTDVAAAMSR